MRSDESPLNSQVGPHFINVALDKHKTTLACLQNSISKLLPPQPFPCEIHTELQHQLLCCNHSRRNDRIFSL
jgi:hypothetical protein